MWWKIWFHHLPEKVLSLQRTQKLNITKKIPLPSKNTNKKFAVGKWKNGIFQCMVMSMSLFIYLFICSHQHLFSGSFYFFISFRVNIFFIPLCTDAIYSEKETEKVYYGIFFPRTKTAYFCSIPSGVWRIYICRWANDHLLVFLLFFSFFCPILDGAFWNEINSRWKVGWSQNIK